MFSDNQGLVLVSHGSHSVLNMLEGQVVVNNDVRCVGENRCYCGTVLLRVVHATPPHGVLSISWNVEES